LLPPEVSKLPLLVSISQLPTLFVIWARSSFLLQTSTTNAPHPASSFVDRLVINRPSGPSKVSLQKNIVPVVLVVGGSVLIRQSTIKHLVKHEREVLSQAEAPFSRRGPLVP
jgi:hypothetical protein